MNKDHPGNKGKWKAWVELGYVMDDTTIASIQEIIRAAIKDQPCFHQPDVSGEKGESYWVNIILVVPNEAGKFVYFLDVLT